MLFATQGNINIKCGARRFRSHPFSMCDQRGSGQWGQRRLSPWCWVAVVVHRLLAREWCYRHIHLGIWSHTCFPFTLSPSRYKCLCEIAATLSTITMVGMYTDLMGKRCFEKPGTLCIHRWVPLNHAS